MDQRAAAAGAHCGQGRDLLLQGEVNRLMSVVILILFYVCPQVQGGDSDSLGKQNYHPFYITSDPNGGYGKKIESERGESMGEFIFTILLSAAHFPLSLSFIE